jgi:SAM-dependent methyltransferase
VPAFRATKEPNLRDSSTDHVDPYAAPAIYDVLHTKGTAFEVDLLERLVRLHGRRAPRTSTWLEPACGTGRYLRVLAGRGARCVGFDLDRGMLAYARTTLAHRGLERRVRLIEADMADFLDHVGRERFDVAFVLVNSLRHLMHPAQVRAHFRQMHAALRPGGLYIVGISLSRYDDEEPSEDVWIGTRGVCTVRQIVQHLPPERIRRRETVFSHLQVDRPSGRSFLDSTYELRSYDRRQLDAVIRASGMQRLGAIDDLGKDVGERTVNYQLEVLRRP